MWRFVGVVIPLARDLFDVNFPVKLEFRRRNIEWLVGWSPGRLASTPLRVPRYPLKRHGDVLEVAPKVTDPEIRRELSELVAQIRARQQQQTTDLRAREKFEAGELARLDIMARRWEVRKAMLEREPAAVLVGGVLLVGIAAALIVAMFVHTVVPEILANGFLLTLGFFFGQNSTRNSSSPG